MNDDEMKNYVKDRMGGLFGAMYRPPAGHARHLTDAERAHSGTPGSKERHGADALNVIPFKKNVPGNELG